MAIYVALVALLAAYFAASAMFGDLESQKDRGAARPVRPDRLRPSDALLDDRGEELARAADSRRPALEPGAVADAESRRADVDRLPVPLRRGPIVEGSAPHRSPRASPVAAVRWVREQPRFTRGTAWGQLQSQLRLETRTVAPEPAVRPDPRVRSHQRPREHGLPGSDARERRSGP